MGIAILVLILAGIVVHRYLTVFDINGLLPWNFGFKAFLIIFWVGCLMNTIWMFGLIWGIIAFLLIFFQVIYSSVLWVFLIPTLNFITKSVENKELFKVKVNMRVYGFWTIIPISLIILGIVNFFISDYKCVLNYINNVGALWILIFLTLIIALGNLIRIRVMKKLDETTQ